MRINQKLAWILFPLLLVACDAQSKANPQQFVNKIYARYQAKDIPDLLGNGGDSIFTTAFLQVYRDFSKESPSKHGLGWDPLCWCDDKEFPGYNITEVKTKTLVSKSAYTEIDVLLKVGGFGEGGILILKKESGNWRIDDIKSEEIPSILGYMKSNRKNTSKTVGQ